MKTIKIIGNFHGTLSYEKQRRVIKKFGWSFRLAGFDALNYCLLAEGTVDAVIEANLKPYDILPLIPIIKNSGAIVTNWKNEPAENGGNILATSNKILHNKILNLLNPFTKKGNRFRLLRISPGQPNPWPAHPACQPTTCNASQLIWPCLPANCQESSATARIHF